MSSPAASSIFIRWLLIALVLRILRAWTHTTWIHPDEWYQTLEMAHLMVNGVGSWSQEVIIHLRNLSWASLLSLPMATVSAIYPDSIRLRLFAPQLLSGLLDLGILWGWWQMIQAWTRRNPDFLRWQQAALASLVLPYFLVRDSVLMSLEHSSTIAFWVMLGCLVTSRWRWAGFLAVAVAAFRYPSGLLSAGAFLALAIQAYRSREWKPWVRFTLGALIGLVIFGIPDAIFYGRPWESLWMYLQYNVFMGLGAANYGTQSGAVYLHFFGARWANALLPFALLVVICAPFGIYQRFKDRNWAEPWLFALLLYLAGHLMIGHKEPRFMAPIELLFVWAAWEGWTRLSRLERVQVWSIHPAMRLLTGLILAVNAILILIVLWGNTWKTDTEYFRVASLLRETPETCAIITVKRHNSFILPKASMMDPPRIPFGHLDMDRGRASYPAEGRMTWVSGAPSCREDQKILLQLHRPDERWIEAGCEWKPSGAYRILSESWSRWLTARRLISGAWYVCPAKIPAVVLSSQIERPLVRGFPPMERLPSLGAPGSDLQRRVDFDRESRPCSALCHVAL